MVVESFEDYSFKCLSYEREEGDRSDTFDLG
jgi:hypothetical protein